LEKFGKLTPEDQRRSLVINGWQAALDPMAHGIPMATKQSSDLLDRVAAVNLDKPVVRMAFAPAPLSRIDRG